MEWERAAAEAERVERLLAGPVSLEEACREREAALALERSLAAAEAEERSDAGATADPNPESTALKAQQLRRHLRVGALAAEAALDPELRRLLDSIADCLLTPELVARVTSGISAVVARAQQVADRIAALQDEVERLQWRREALSALVELLDELSALPHREFRPEEAQP